MKFGSPFFNSITEYGLLVVMLVMYAMCLHTVEHLSLSSFGKIVTETVPKRTRKNKKSFTKNASNIMKQVTPAASSHYSFTRRRKRHKAVKEDRKE